MISNSVFKLSVLALGTVALVACSNSEKKQIAAESYVDWVDPLIGSGGHGHVFVGASIPHGMIQLGPNNHKKGWNWCSGYHDSDSTIIGFAHTHLSGTGIADLGDILLMPAVSVIDSAGYLPSSAYVSTFLKQEELVTPGFYQVKLHPSGVNVELTAGERVGMHRYVYPSDKKAQVVVDLENSAQSLMLREGTISSELQLINDSTVVGVRSSDEWAMNHTVYFRSVFSKPILNSRLYAKEKGKKMVLDFGILQEPLLVKTAVSYVSSEGALANLEAEHRTFDEVHEDAVELWNDALSKIQVEVKDDNVKKMFYTALYHTMISPSVFQDVDGSYKGADGKVYQTSDFVPYTIFSLWDTYRAVHPLYTLIDTRNADYVNSLLAIYDQQKSLPIWHLAANETSCMVGVHSIPVIVDACLKGFSGIDVERAYQAVKSIREMNDNGLDFVRNQEYIPADKISWSVARALEYAIDDYAVAQLAKHLGKEDDYQLFMKRSKYYAHYFDSDSGFMRGKLADGSWRLPFDPSHSLHMEDDYVEGNAWQYTWLVPHDPQGLVKLFGGKKQFVEKLDSLFIVSSELNEGASIDITGMIGQYAHGNEPSHHILYLYPYVGERAKAAKLLHQVYDSFYKATPDGLIGNEDCGQMSAWYIFSAMGFYPVNPVDGTFVFGSPLLDRVTMNLNNGKKFEIIAHNNSQRNIYIKSIKLNGKPYDKFYITYEDIMNGGVLEFEMVDILN